MNDQQTTRYISTTDTAKEVRKALRAQWPGVKFSVRKGTGTGSAWIRVSWEDGPRYEDVRQVVDRFEGARFNGMTDSYDQMPDQLVVTTAGELPEVINYVCDGINCDRDFSEQAIRAVARELIEQNPRLFANLAITAGDLEHLGEGEIRGAFDIIAAADECVNYRHHVIVNNYNRLGVVLNAACSRTDFTIDYIAAERCDLCGERLADPHGPMCPKYDA